MMPLRVDETIVGKCRRPGLLIAACLLLAVHGAAAGEEPPRFWRDKATGLEFAFVPGGCFLMGAERPGEIGRKGWPSPPRADEVPRHEVCVDPFWLSRTEVTYAAWRQLMPERAESKPVAADRPVTGVAIEDAELFLQRLNNVAAGQRFRLPTEAEWEYACLPGEPASPMNEKHGPRSQELLAVARYREPLHDDPVTAPVAMRKDNRYGLYDMLGNVWEWTADTYAADAYAGHARNNPRHSAATGRQVMRGGSFKTDIYQTRCGARAWGVRGDRLESVGFRVLRVHLPDASMKQ